MSLRWRILFALSLCLAPLPAGAQSIFITEFMAANASTLQDEDGDSSDWIELFNASGSTVNLAGWFLTDSPANLVRWAFPAVNLEPRQFLIVFASAKNRTNAAVGLHTNFKLDASGDYLALVQPDGLTIAHEYAPFFPPQVTSLSYGVAMAGLEVSGLTPGFLVPSPRLGNGPFIGVGPTITNVSHSPTEPTAAEAVRIRVKVQPSSIPVQTVTLYYRVLFGPTFSLIMADDGLHQDDDAGDGIFEAIIPGSLANPGEMIRWYVQAADTAGNQSRLPPFRDPTGSAEYFGTVVANPLQASSLPVVHLFITPTNLSGANGSSTTRVPCSIYYLGEFYDNVGINRHGQSSAGVPKKSYDLDFHRDQPFRWALLGARVRDINLLTTYPDKSHLRNLLAYEYTFKPAGSPYHFVEPVRVQTNGGFFGLWHLVENGDADFLQRNGRDPRGALYKMYNPFTTLINTIIGSDPGAEKKTRQEEGNADLVALFNGLVAEPLLTNRVRYLYDNVDVAEVLNSLAARAVTSDSQCCHKNYYLYRDSDGTGEWQSFPWDVELSFGRNWSSTQTYWDTTVYPNTRIWGNWDNNGVFQVLLNMPPGRGPDATRQMYLRRVRTLMDELQASDHYTLAVDYWSSVLARESALDLAKWGTWGNGVTGIFDPASPYYQSLFASVAELKTNYMVNRRRFVFEQKMGLPAEFPDAQPPNVVIGIGSIDYNPASGNQDEEYIELINTNTIAVDISGWRLSGAVNHTFQGGVVLPRGQRPTNSLYVVRDKRAFRARATGPRGAQGLRIEGSYTGQLSARGETITLSDQRGRTVSTLTYPGTPSLAQQFLRIEEISYRPGPGPGDDRFSPDHFAFVEFLNIGPVPIDLTRVRVDGSIRFDFTNSAIRSLAPGQRLVVVQNLEAFGLRYGPNVPVAGPYVGSLDTTEGRLRVEESGENILDFAFAAAWHPITDGGGFSLVVRNPAGPVESWDLEGSWRPSGVELGTPGQPDPGALPPAPSVVINEVLSNPSPPHEDAIELYNSSPARADISHWYLTDDLAQPRKFRLPLGTTVAPFGYLGFDEHAFNSDPTLPASFAIGANGDSVYLFSGDAEGRLTGYVHGFKFGAAETNTPFGRYVDSQSKVHFVAQTEITLGSQNAGPKVGPIVISEIQYRPITLPDGQDNLIDEFVELANITSAMVPLFDPSHPTNTWRFRGGVDFDFPPGITLPPNGYALLVSFNPDDVSTLTAFRTRFGIPGVVPVFGPFSGRLSNGGEELRLLQPASTLFGVAPYILIDEVEYANQRPWPTAADATGPTLQRRVLNDYGNDPANWTAVGPTPGLPFLADGIPPTVVDQPVNTIGVVGQTAIIRVGVNGSSPLFHQWRFNGANLFAPNSPILTLRSVIPTDAGLYSCVILNSAGSATSEPARLTVVYPPAIFTQPADVLVRIPPDPAAAPSTNALFQVIATTSNPPLKYQWHFNGTAIPAATNDSVLITNVTLVHEGDYACLIGDAAASIFSQNARLIPLITPRITVPPLSQLVTTGAMVTVSAAATGHPLPFTFEWRHGSTPVANHVVAGREDFWTFTAPTNIGTNSYRVVVKNQANFAPGVPSPIFSVVTLIDTDADGLPDDFETAHGLNESDATDATLDSDGDGMTNGAEYIAGTDPRDPQSYLRIEPPMFTLPGMSTGPSIEFRAISNRTYTVEAQDAIVPPLPWQVIGAVMATPTNRSVLIVDPQPTSTNAQRIYRLVTPRQP